jgi:hypothetical protein
MTGRGVWQTFPISMKHMVNKIVRTTRVLTYRERGVRRASLLTYRASRLALGLTSRPISVDWPVRVTIKLV